MSTSYLWGWSCGNESSELKVTSRCRRLPPFPTCLCLRLRPLPPRGVVSCQSGGPCLPLSSCGPCCLQDASFPATWLPPPPRPPFLGLCPATCLLYQKQFKKISLLSQRPLLMVARPICWFPNNTGAVPPALKKRRQCCTMKWNPKPPTPGPWDKQLRALLDKHN